MSTSGAVFIVCALLSFVSLLFFVCYSLILATLCVSLISSLSSCKGGAPPVDHGHVSRRCKRVHGRGEVHWRWGLLWKTGNGSTFARATGFSLRFACCVVRLCERFFHSAYDLNTRMLASCQQMNLRVTSKEKPMPCFRVMDHDGNILNKDILPKEVHVTTHTSFMRRMRVCALS